MKNRPMLGALAAVVITQAGCATQIKSVPLQPAMQQPAAEAASRCISARNPIRRCNA
jgi:hypothetical protein